jgi:AcrR family transcriptional regulator
MSSSSGGRRRTQEERSATTVAKLIDATIKAIVEEGYAGATTREICERAGISQGGLFRHFPTRRDLIVAMLEHIYVARSVDFAEVLEPDLGGESATRIAAQLRRVRDFVRDPMNMVFLEVTMASRTEPDLREGVVSLLQRADREILAIASRNPVVARMSDQSRRVWLDFAQQVLWIEALWATSLPERAYDDMKISALVRLMFVLADGQSTGASVSAGG